MSRDISPQQIVLGEAIRKMRERRGWTQQRLALEIDPELHPQNVQRWEKSKASPPAPELLRIMQLCEDRASFEFFGIDIAKICRRLEEGEKGEDGGKNVRPRKPKFPSSEK